MTSDAGREWLSRHPFLGYPILGVVVLCAGVGVGLSLGAAMGKEATWSGGGALAMMLARTLLPALLGSVWVIKGYQLSIGCWITGVITSALTPIELQLQNGEVTLLSPIASVFWAAFSTGLFAGSVKLNTTTWRRAQDHV